MRRAWVMPCLVAAFVMGFALPAGASAHQYGSANNFVNTGTGRVAYSHSSSLVTLYDSKVDGHRVYAFYRNAKTNPTVSGVLWNKKGGGTQVSVSAATTANMWIQFCFDANNDHKPGSGECEYMMRTGASSSTAFLPTGYIQYWPGSNQLRAHAYACHMCSRMVSASYRFAGGSAVDSISALVEGVSSDKEVTKTISVPSGAQNIYFNVRGEYFSGGTSIEYRGIFRTGS